ncbi:MAG TPA: aldo/keto reductase [Chloroflexota bacterium]|nr:aldo/keto reductase [Chloroflexota bacterium]
MTTGQRVSAEAAGSFELGEELAVNRLGFGAMRITGQGIWGPPANHDEALAVLRRAVELDINLIDTADAYGPEVSENLIAEALYPYPEGLVIATKGGQTRQGPGEWVPNGRPDYLQRAVDGSLRRLRLDCIDLYQLHRPDPDVPLEESVGALKDMQDAGKVRFVGLSNVNTDQLKRAQSITRIVSVQNKYNMTDRASEEVLECCARDGIGFIPWFPLAMGELAREGSELSRIAEHHHVSPAQVALAWLLHHSPVMLPIPGTSSVHHLEENVAAASLDLGHEELAELD